MCHLTSVHSRFDIRIFHKECISLARKGFKLSLVVADGKGDEFNNGVAIHDVGASNGRFDRMRRAPNRVFKKALSLDAEIYHFHDPELIPVGLGLKRHGKKVVFDVHEDYVSQIREKKYLPRFLRNLIAAGFDFYEKKSVPRFDGIIVVADHQLDRYKKISGNAKVVQNFVDLEYFAERDLDYSRVRILHAGTLTEARGLPAMIALADRLRSLGDIYLAGALSGGMDADDLEPAKYLGVLEPAELIENYNNSNLGLILYRPVGQYGKATAIKLYEYMAAGVPVIVPNHGEWPDVVRRLGVGVAVDVFDTEAQVKLVRWFKDNPGVANEMGKRGRKYVSEHASWGIAEAELLNMYATL